MPQVYLCEKNELESILFLMDLNINNYGNPESTMDKIEESGVKVPDTIDFPNYLVKTYYDTISKDGKKIARININGYLANEVPWFLNGTSYRDIIRGVELANKDNTIDEIELYVNSPGGEVGIVDDVWMTIYNSDKPVTAIASGMMASGAYYIASAADKIVSTSPLNKIGSIGVVVVGYAFTEEFLKKVGVKRIIITSKNAKNKYNPIDTEQGEKEIQDLVDATERRFINRISTGRNISEKDVIKTFGNGLVFVSRDTDSNYTDALSRGMIDGITNVTKIKNNMDSIKLSSGEMPKITEREDVMEITEKELQEKLEKAKQEGRLEGIKSSAEKAESILNVLRNGNYPTAISNLGYDAIVGKMSQDGFMSSLAVYESFSESMKLKNTENEEKEVEHVVNPGEKNEEIDKDDDNISTDDIDKLIDKGEWS